MFKPLMKPSENTGTDFLSKTLNGKRPMEPKLNPPMGNHLIITDNNFYSIPFHCFKKIYTQETSKIKK